MIHKLFNARLTTKFATIFFNMVVIFTAIFTLHFRS